MCGILAVFCDKLPQNTRNLQKILNAAKILKKRGPDRCSSYIGNDGIYIFHRLCINDTVNGDQPMYWYEDDRKIVMMCNGEIYNHEELCKKYEIKCESKSDCEIIMHLYRKIGFVEMYKELDGYFSIVIVEGDEMYFACDTLGVRPLYMGIVENDEKTKSFALASLPEVLLEFCTDVKIVEGGRCFVVQKNKSNVSCLHITKVEPLFPKINEKPEEEIRNVLMKAVQKRLMTNRPIASLLSGGLDSSIITAILCTMLNPKDVQTFSVGMKGSTDLTFARMMAKHLGTRHTEVIFSFEEGFAIIPRVIRELATYDITTIRASVGMYLISKFIKENSDAKVIFSGEGSDEAFMGYLYFHNSPSYEASEQESIRLLTEMHNYDILRADRTISSNGLELRAPFLDRDVINTAMSLLPIDKAPDVEEKVEKHLLRAAFKDLLPEQILWRRKEGFSDGVSSMELPFYVQIQKKLDQVIPDYMFNPHEYVSKEAMYYKMIFKHWYPKYDLNIPYWMPKWSNTNDPSGRLIALEINDDDSDQSMEKT